jgi:hypothetical protein
VGAVGEIKKMVDKILIHYFLFEESGESEESLNFPLRNFWVNWKIPLYRGP